METIRGAVKHPEIVDAPLLASYQDTIGSLEEELQGLRKEILFVEDIGERLRRASDIDGNLFDS